jgi:hypothetical protein
VKIATENKTGKKNISQTAVEITIPRSKKELKYYRGTGEEFQAQKSGKW